MKVRSVLVTPPRQVWEVTQNCTLLQQAAEDPVVSTLVLRWCSKGEDELNSLASGLQNQCSFPQLL